MTFAKRREVDIESEKLNQIKGRNRLIKINGKEQFIEIQDLEDLGELGNGTSGQVIKMKHRPTNKVIAVKVKKNRLLHLTLFVMFFNQKIFCFLLWHTFHNSKCGVPIITRSLSESGMIWMLC